MDDDDGPDSRYDGRIMAVTVTRWARRSRAYMEACGRLLSDATGQRAHGTPVPPSPCLQSVNDNMLPAQGHLTGTEDGDSLDGEVIWHKQLQCSSPTNAKKGDILQTMPGVKGNLPCGT